MIVEQGLVTGGIGQFGLGQTGSQGRRRQVVECVLIDLETMVEYLVSDAGSERPRGTMWSSMGYLGHSCAKIASKEKLVPLQFSLDYDEGKVCFGVHVARHLLDGLYLLFDALVDALEQAIDGPLEEFWSRSLGDPGAREELEVASLPGYRVESRIDLAEDVVDIHGSWRGGGESSGKIGLCICVSCCSLNYA